jgi:hypothetical protein
MRARESVARSEWRLNAAVLVAGCCALAVVVGLGVLEWPRPEPRDFEQCAAEAERTALSSDERASLTEQCDRRFAGRRKMGGGYTYYDFLQNRHFDIAGPNPTPEELKSFDEQYTSYLAAQRRDAIAAAFAEKRTGQDDRAMAPLSPPGPLSAVSAPASVPLPKARSAVVRSRGPCEEASLSCTWTRFSSGIRLFFESNARTPRP